MCFKEEPTQLSMGQTAHSLACSMIKKPHTGLDECPRILLSCFRARIPGGIHLRPDCSFLAPAARSLARPVPQFRERARESRETPSKSRGTGWHLKRSQEVIHGVFGQPVALPGLLMTKQCSKMFPTFSSRRNRSKHPIRSPLPIDLSFCQQWPLHFTTFYPSLHEVMRARIWYTSPLLELRL